MTIPAEPEIGRLESTCAIDPRTDGRRAWCAMRALAGFEFRVAARSRLTLAAAGIFMAAAVAVSWLGLFGAGYLDFQGFERTAISLISLIASFAPLLGMLLAVSAFADGEGSDLLFAQPVDRAVVVLGRLAGLTGAIAAATAIGLGGAGLVIASRAGADGVGAFIALVVVAFLLGTIFTGLAAAGSLIARTRLQASGATLALWIWFVLVYDLVALAALVVVPESSVRPFLLAALAASPIMLARVAAFLALGAETALGPAGALLLKMFGTSGALAATLVGLVAWVAFAWTLPVLIARRRDV